MIKTTAELIIPIEIDSEYQRKISRKLFDVLRQEFHKVEHDFSQQSIDSYCYSIYNLLWEAEETIENVQAVTGQDKEKNGE